MVNFSIGFISAVLSRVRPSLLWLLAGAFPILVSTTAPAQAPVRVDSSKVVNATGVQAITGQVLTIQATGAVNLSLFDGPYDIDPNGTIVVAPPPGSGSYNFFRDFTAPIGVPPAVGSQKFVIPPYEGQLEGAAYGALVAGFSPNPNASSVSDFPNGFTLVGASRNVTAPIDGYLFLAVNDINNTSDNSGSYSAVITTCPVNVTLSWTPNLSSMRASFTPGSGLSLDAAATACGFIMFDWVQVINLWSAPGLLAELAPTTRIVVPPALPFFDPVQGGYKYQYDYLGYWLSVQPHFSTASPFYYSPLDVPTGIAATVPIGTPLTNNFST